MDCLQYWEIPLLIGSLEYLDRTSWEQTRAMVWSVASMLSSKKIEVQDVMKFPWEKEQPQVRAVATITDDELARLKSEADKIAKTIR